MSNCLIFAIGQWWRYGGFVIVRRSERSRIPWPHFLHSVDLVTFSEYVPPGDNHRVLIPPPLYRGVVKIFRKRAD